MAQTPITPLTECEPTSTGRELDEGRMLQLWVGQTFHSHSQTTLPSWVEAEQLVAVVGGSPASPLRKGSEKVAFASGILPERFCR